MNSTLALLGLLIWLSASCAPDAATGTSPTTPTSEAAAAAPVHKSLEQRIEQKNSYKQDTSGNWVPVNYQRSAFASKGASPYFQDQYAKKSYATPDVAKKSWWGNKSYERQKYADTPDASRFQKSSPLSGKGAHEAGTTAETPGPYQTGHYATSAARESHHRGVEKPSDTETDIRRKVYQEPEIIGWKEQRTLSVSQSKGILGR